jgi:hypothetical protein
MRPANVLLILSSRQKPTPESEVRALREEAEHNSEIQIATSRYVNGLEAGRSEIGLFGDRELDHRLLAQGTFEGFVPQATDKGRETRDSSPLYRRTRPTTVVGYLRISKFSLAEDPRLESLNGLTIGNRPLDRTAVADPDRTGGPFDRSWPSEFGNENTSIYYMKARGPEDRLTIEEESRLWSLKCRELLKKTAQLADLWHDAENDFSELAKDNERLERRCASLVSENKELRVWNEQQQQKASQGLQRKFRDFRLHPEAIIENATNVRALMGTWSLLFPRLDTAKEFEGFLRGISAKDLRSVIDRLVELDGACLAWGRGDTERPIYPFYERPDGETAIKKYPAERTFTCPHLGQQLFSLHANVRPEGFRLHWIENPDQRRITVGYYGRHLKTKKY